MIICIGGVAIGCAGCAMHTGPALWGPKICQTLFFQVMLIVDCIRINLENHSLDYENRICSIRMQLAAS